VTDSHEPDDWAPGLYCGSADTTVVINGSTFWVGVHMALVDGRFRCVGIDVRSFVEDLGDSPRRGVKRLTNDGWVAITSPVIRSLRVAEVIERAQRPMRDLLLETVDALTEAHGRPADEPPGQLVDHVLGRDKPRRGPRPQLDDEALRDVVAAAYRLALNRPVQAVRLALEESGALRRPVTIDQARKAVATARAKGFIPPATPPRSRQEDQS
jgi:hypothetical protein